MDVFVLKSCFLSTCSSIISCFSNFWASILLFSLHFSLFGGKKLVFLFLALFLRRGNDFHPLIVESYAREMFLQKRILFLFRYKCRDKGKANGRIEEFIFLIGAYCSARTDLQHFDSVLRSRKDFASYLIYQ